MKPPKPSLPKRAVTDLYGDASSVENYQRYYDDPGSSENETGDRQYIKRARASYENYKAEQELKIRQRQQKKASTHFEP